MIICIYILKYRRNEILFLFFFFDDEERRRAHTEFRRNNNKKWRFVLLNCNIYEWKRGFLKLWYEKEYMEESKLYTNPFFDTKGFDQLDGLSLYYLLCLGVFLLHNQAITE